jgi:hypothetical protein
LFNLGGKKACSIIEAESKAKEFIAKQHVAVENIHVAITFPKRKFWVVNGEASFKHFHSVSNVAFEAQVNMNTGEVTSYKETQLKYSKKHQRGRSP